MKKKKKNCFCKLSSTTTEDYIPINKVEVNSDSTDLSLLNFKIYAPFSNTDGGIQCILGFPNFSYYIIRWKNMNILDMNEREKIGTGWVEYNGRKAIKENQEDLIFVKMFQLKYNLKVNSVQLIDLLYLISVQVNYGIKMKVKIIH